MTDKISSESFSACPTPLSEHATIQMAHGSGGRLMHQLIQEMFIAKFDSDQLKLQEDQAQFVVNGARLAFSTDSFVVDPLFFPGGNIGDLAVNGTVNDIAMCGAQPLYLSCAFIIEEGLPIETLTKIVRSMHEAAEKAGVQIVTGDTKVVNKGQVDKLFITTSGVGVINHPYTLGAGAIQVGDVVVLSGSLADHGVAVMSQRAGLKFETTVSSDCCALNSLVEVIMQTGQESIHAMRDPTRGGLAATLNEFVGSGRLGIQIEERAIPIAPAVAGACEMLGLDPLLVANEGKLVAFVATAKAQDVLAVMRQHEHGSGAQIIGVVVSDFPGRVVLRTRLGTERLVDMPLGEQLPRIC